MTISYFLLGSHVEDIALHSPLHMRDIYLRSSVPIKPKLLRIERLIPYSFRDSSLMLFLNRVWSLLDAHNGRRSCFGRAIGRIPSRLGEPPDAPKSTDGLQEASGRSRGLPGSL